MVFYGETRVTIQINAPEPRWEEVDTNMFVESDYAGNKKSCKSRSGYMIYISITLVLWYLKKQSTVRISVFRAEFVVP